VFREQELVTLGAERYARETKGAARVVMADLYWNPGIAWEPVESVTDVLVITGVEDEVLTLRKEKVLFQYKDGRRVEAPYTDQDRFPALPARQGGAAGDPLLPGNQVLAAGADLVTGPGPGSAGVLLIVLPVVAGVALVALMIRRRRRR
jgi:hypothetical protein